MPNLFTEFGSFTVGESMAHIYSVIGEKIRTTGRHWYMIGFFFITTLPDTWGIGEKFLMLPINKWDNEYHRVVLGGITCDSHDYYDMRNISMRYSCPRSMAVGTSICWVFPHRGIPGSNQWLWRY
jgi:diaminopimelate decarboxylase